VPVPRSLALTVQAIAQACGAEFLLEDPAEETTTAAPTAVVQR